MTLPAVFITRKIAEPAIKKLTGVAQVEIWPQESPPPYDVLLEKARHVDGILTMLTDRIDSNLISHAGPNLKVISQLAVGFDNIDIKAATEKGVAVGNTPGALTETTADFAWALMMAAARRVVEGHNEVHSGVWQAWGPDVLTGYDVYGATLGIIGYGRIGQAVARRAKGFNMRVLYHGPSRKPADDTGAEYVSLDELLTQSDFVSLHTYLSKETYHLIDRDKLAKMKPTAILINTARGAVVDPEALAWAIQEKIISAAALDVTEPEPILQDSPLLKHSNIIITPHIGSASKATRARMADMAVENLIAGIRKERLPDCVNPHIYQG